MYVCVCVCDCAAVFFIFSFVRVMREFVCILYYLISMRVCYRFNKHFPAANFRRPLMYSLAFSPNKTNNSLKILVFFLSRSSNRIKTTDTLRSVSLFVLRIPYSGFHVFLCFFARSLAVALVFLLSLWKRVPFVVPVIKLCCPFSESNVRQTCACQTFHHPPSCVK